MTATRFHRRRTFAFAFACAVATAAAFAADAPPRVAPLRVNPWMPAEISSERFESHPAFDPVTGDVYFVRSSPAFEGWRILVSRCTPAGWSPPSPTLFAGNGVEADPAFSADGNTLYFVSTRSSDGVERKDLDIWRVQRDAGGHWGAPERMSGSLNSTANEWSPRMDRDGWLYFGSDRSGGLGRSDIWRGRIGDDGQWQVENAGAALNTAGDENEALPSPDGASLILRASDGLYRSRRVDGVWQPREKLPAPVTVDGSEIGPLFSPSGHSLLFARDLKGARSGEFFVWHIEGDEAWPPSCPAAKRGEPKTAKPKARRGR